MEVASATYRFQKQGNRYRLDTEARASGVLAVFYSGTLVQVSEGVMSAQGFVPARYSEKRGRRPERRYRFDGPSRHVRQEGDPAIDFAYPDGTQDRLTIFFQLGLLARADAQRFKPGQKFVLPLAGSRRIDEPFFRVVSRGIPRCTKPTKTEILRCPEHICGPCSWPCSSRRRLSCSRPSRFPSATQIGRASCRERV